MKRNLLLIGIILFSFPCYSWDLSGIAGGRGSSMGFCSVASNDFWSVHNNPAGMADWRTLTLGFSYENRFFMKELSVYNTACILPVKFGVFGMSYNRFGFENYNENKVGLSYARAFGPHLKIGLQLDYLMVNFSDNYEKRRTATFELGMQSNITDDLCFGVYIFNPTNSKIKSIDNQHIPIVLRFGFSYKITKDFLATTEVEYNNQRKLDYRIGLEYNTLNDFYIRVGVRTNPATACFGIGYTLNRITVDVGATMNQCSGVSFQSSLIFKIKEAGL
ncbi:MAG: hypothetical protein IJK92_01105 [Bacteroidales bacterium]|nr:hypothetical protein [Bacteroidales bacterium]